VRLRYTRPALADLQSVLDYIASRSPQGTQRVQRRILSITELLRRHPAIGRRTENPAIRRIGTSPYPYLVFYEATDTEIIIHAVRHMARDPSGMPGDRA
jgi:plasmid stabilization system protein ParE